MSVDDQANVNEKPETVDMRSREVNKPDDQAKHGKPLTRDARWIILWARYVHRGSILPLVPHETVFNIGRFSYDIPTERAISEALDFTNDTVLASKIYIIDVTVFPYAKQHKDVTEMATRWFRNHGAAV